MIRCGIDLGGTKIEGVLIDDSLSHEVISKIRIPTEGHQGYHHILGNISKLIEALKKRIWM